MKARLNIRHSTNGTASAPEISALIPQLKAKVGKRLVRQFGGIVPGTLIGRALDEAVETASATGFPHLFFPVLAEEKVRLVSAAIHEERADHAMFYHAA